MHTMSELSESLDAIDSWVIVSHSNVCPLTEQMCNSKSTFCIGWEPWVTSVLHGPLCGLDFVCWLENTKVLLRRN